jgi:DNA repair exonuclease SbcCD nuclease subunit
LALPARESGDASIRIGLVHGSTFDIPDAQTNFPIDEDAALKRGFDYLAIGDTHGFRFVPPDRETPPTIYPGAPEATAFDERDPGYVAVVFITRQRRARVHKERVARWTWEEVTVHSFAELQALRDRRDLASRVLRLRLDMSLAPDDFDRAERLLNELEGNMAAHGLVGVLDLQRAGLTLDTTDLESALHGLPDVLKAAARRLKQEEAAAHDPEVPRRALRRLFKLAREVC